MFFIIFFNKCHNFGLCHLMHLDAEPDEDKETQPSDIWIHKPTHRQGVINAMSR